MDIMRVHAKQGCVDTDRTEALVILLCEDDSLATSDGAVLDRALGGVLRELQRSREFEGKLHEVMLLHTHGKLPAKRLILAGLGKRPQLGLDQIRQAMGYAVKRVRQAKAGSFTVVLPSAVPPGASVSDLSQTLTEGAILGNYQFTAYRSEGPVGKGVAAMTILVSQKSHLSPISEGVRRGIATAEATVFVRDLCNHPSNVMTPTKIASEAKAIAKDTGVNLKILEQKEMERLGMGALLGVAKGSHEPPKFIILQYHGAKKKDDSPVVLVGKNITFDTG